MCWQSCYQLLGLITLFLTKKKHICALAVLLCFLYCVCVLCFMGFFFDVPLYFAGDKIKVATKG